MTVMEEAPLQIVGCLLLSEPADPLIDGFVTAVRRERAMVTARNAQSATFVKFNAPDAKLVAMACAAAAGTGGRQLRFGFACAAKPRAPAAQDAWSLSNRCITQARDLAAAAQDGEVLVSAQLAVLLVESGLSFQAKEVQLSNGRETMACSLALDAAAPEPATPVESERRQTGALGSVFQVLLAQAEAIARKQDELEARQDAALGEPGAASSPGGLQADLDAQLTRLEARLVSVDQIEQRIDRLQHVGTEVDGKLELIEARRKMVDEMQSRSHGIVNMLKDINVNLEMLSEQRAVVDHVGEKLARLDFTLQEAHNTLRALQREREVAERIEQGIKALRTRSGAHVSTLHGDALATPPEAKRV